MVFTFQYGSTQIEYSTSIGNSKFYLHSNMDLLKYSLATKRKVRSWIYIPIWIYSNLYRPYLPCRLFRIYIPIWIYSNEIDVRVARVDAKFTFQYGSTQIKYLEKPLKENINLHSNMDLLKWQRCLEKN